jgi:mannose-6-phosphate isomerase-like protein (cupin superfamily)
MIVKKSERKKHANAPTCTASEYSLGDKDIDVAYIEINGRYPENGRAMNRISKEVVFVVNGGGKVEIDGKGFVLNEGDSVIIQPKQKYFFEGKLKTVISCHPSWNPEQYEDCD